MSVILEVSLDREAFDLGRALTPSDGVRVELERLVPTPNTATPFVWVDTADTDAFETDLDGEPDIGALAPLDRVGDKVLYRVEWTGENDFVDGVVAADGSVLRAVGEETWFFQIRFLDHDHLTRFYDYCTEHDIPLTVERVYEPTGDGLAADLSSEQREALALALDRGYFDTPRSVTMTELADELGITQQAFSDRLRRGTKTVLQYAFHSADGV